MKKSSQKSVIGLLIVLGLLLGQAPPSLAQAASSARQEGPVSTPKATPAIDASIAQAQEHLRLVTAGFVNGANTNEDVSEAKIALAEARIRSATERGQFTGLRQGLETIVTQRQSLLDQANVRLTAGIASPSDTNTAGEALAEARVRLDLYSVLSARQARLSETSVRQRAGIATVEEMEKANSALQRAQLHFVESGDDR